MEMTESTRMLVMSLVDALSRLDSEDVEQVIGNLEALAEAIAADNPPGAESADALAYGLRVANFGLWPDDDEGIEAWCDELANKERYIYDAVVSEGAHAA